jgi:hypothetical protein
MLGIETSDSPFIFLWYAFLAFIGAVILVNIICILVGMIYKRQIRKLYAAKDKVDAS